MNGKGYFKCAEGERCLEYSEFYLEEANPEKNSQTNWDITTFSHLGRALLTVVQTVSMDSWAKIMMNLMDADIPWIVTIYFVFLIFLCSFFILNIILAVIVDAFIKIQTDELNE